MLASCLLTLGAGCTSIIGSFSEGPPLTDSGNPDTGGMDVVTKPDTGGHPDGGHEGGGHPDGMPDTMSGDVVTGDVVTGDVVTDDVVTSDVVSGDVVVADAPTDAPVPVTANMATANVAGGQYSTSKNYTLFGAVGQSPGGNTASTSKSYQLQGGIIGATQ